MTARILFLLIGATIASGGFYDRLHAAPIYVVGRFSLNDGATGMRFRLIVDDSSGEILTNAEQLTIDHNPFLRVHNRFVDYPEYFMNGAVDWRSGEFDIRGRGNWNLFRLGANSHAFRATHDQVTVINVHGGVTIYEVSQPEVKAYPTGDVNLDGRFDSADIVQLFKTGRYLDTQPGYQSRWVDGDFNGDLRFDSSDILVAFRSGYYDAQPLATAAVPEPATCTVSLLVALLTFYLVRRRAN